MVPNIMMKRHQKRHNLKKNESFCVGKMFKWKIAWMREGSALANITIYSVIQMNISWNSFI